MTYKIKPLNGKEFIFELDAGHGYGNAHNRGFVGGNEGDYNYKGVQLLKKWLLTYKDVKVRETRPNQKDDPSLEARGRAAKGADILYSWHTNATAPEALASGAEIYDDVNPKNSNYALAKKLGTAIANAQGIRFRGVFYRKLANGSNWYGLLRNSLAKNTFLVEHCFHDNPREARNYMDNLDKIAKTAAEALADYYGLVKKDGTSSVSGKEDKREIVQDIEITGKSELTKEELLEFFESFNVKPKISISMEKLIDIFLVEGEVEGIRGDIAFIQSVHETGKFQFSGDVIPEQNNFSGIGTTGNGVKGHYFNSPQEGIRAQIQHLKAYASKESLKNKKIDPRFDLVTRGSATTARALTGKWATDKSYGDRLMGYYNEAMKFKKTGNLDVTGGNDTMKYDFIIALKDKRDIEAALEIAARHKSIITLNGKIDYADKGHAQVIALGGPREVHTSYADYFIAGDTAEDTYHLSRKFAREGKATRDKFIAPKKK